uniref:hypothetical protein n=1 Tax=Klebsiella quasipneumoniae TaxID=1463165 RepID=UPI0022E539A4
QPATGETYPKSDLFNKALQTMWDQHLSFPDIIVVYQTAIGERILNHDPFEYQSAIDSDVILQLLLSYLYVRKLSLILIYNRISSFAFKIIKNKFEKQKFIDYCYLTL